MALASNQLCYGLGLDLAVVSWHLRTVRKRHVTRKELYMTVRELLTFLPFSFFSLALDSCIRTTNWTGFRPTTGASPFLYWLSSWQQQAILQEYV
jgi:hypothetical protein